MSAFDFFEKVYCVHDKTLTQRHEKITKALRNFEIEWIFADRPESNYRSSNYRNPPGEFGNTLSHLKVFINALEYYNKYNNNNFLVFEDDVELKKDVNVENILTKALNNLPEEWGILYLGGSPQSPVISVNPPLYKTDRFICCFSYAINTKYLASLTKFYVDQLGKPWPKSVGDNIINNYFVENNIPIYCIYPFIISHLTGYSDINKTNHKYGDIYFEKIWQFQLKEGQKL
jgi:GR25 family glycosyltransferase involved in LPS biosynthesis